MSTTKEILIAARALIADPEHWTTGWYARNKDYQRVDPTDPSAVCFCAIGALARTMSRNPKDMNGVGPLIALAKQVGAIPLFNDLHGHTEVLAAFDAAIEAQDGTC